MKKAIAFPKKEVILFAVFSFFAPPAVFFAEEPVSPTRTHGIIPPGRDIDARPSPTHYLLTLHPDNSLLRDPDSTPAIRFCTFETLRPLA